jgi:hypothetical protein
MEKKILPSCLKLSKSEYVRREVCEGAMLECGLLVFVTLYDFVSGATTKMLGIWAALNENIQVETNIDKILEMFAS